MRLVFHSCVSGLERQRESGHNGNTTQTARSSSTSARGGRTKYTSTDSDAPMSVLERLTKETAKGVLEKK